MTDAPTPQPAAKQQLGVSDILSNTFGLYFSNFPYFFGIFFIPYFTIQLLAGLLGYGGATGSPDAAIAGVILVTLVSFIIFFVIQAVMVRSAITVKLGEGVQFGPALRAGLAGVIPIIILGIAAGLATGVGFIFLIVPGLYLLAMFYVYVPSIVFEGKGFSALGRSIDLTSGYRWAIVGLVLVFIVLLFLASIVIGVVVAGFLAATGGFEAQFAGDMGLGGVVGLTLIDAVLNSAVTPIGMIATGLVFARLKEIKEGGSTQELLKVFE